MPSLPPQVLENQIDDDYIAALGNKINKFGGFDFFKAPEDDIVVEFKVTQFQCACPVTGQPDFYKVHITYVPDDKCLESKSLKLYIESFVDNTYFAEHIAHKMEKDLSEALGVQVEIILEQSVRGGIITTVQAGGV